jgi:ribosomal protein S18 acetylase RimI-like enzyme
MTFRNTTLAAPRELSIVDLDDIVDLHNVVHAEHVAGGSPFDHGVFARETREFFHHHLLVRGRAFGVHLGGRLIAYGILGLPGLDDDNFGTLAALSLKHLDRVAHIDGVAVHPQYRGRKLQILLIEHRLIAAFNRGRDIVYTTVSPCNPHSLANLFKTGFVIVGRRALFGGHDRFIMAWAYPRTAPNGEVIEVDLADTTSQNQLFHEGFIAFGSSVKEKRETLSFSPMTAIKATWSGYVMC